LGDRALMRRNKGGGFGRGGSRGVGGGYINYQDGECVCPNCGYREGHQRGNPCNLKRCNQCGTLMVRL